MKKLICLALAVLLTAGTLASCGKKSDKKVFRYTVDENLFNVIEADGTSKFDIVRAENAPAEVLSACIALKNAILENTGVELEVKSDFEKAGYAEYQRQDNEILVGHTNREESDLAANELSKARDMAILQSGTRIAILAGDDRYIGDAVQTFIDEFIHPDTCTVSAEPSQKVVSHYDYPVKSFTINGTDISEYAVTYSSDEYKSIADGIRSFVYDQYGISIATGKSIPKKSNATREIMLEREDKEPFLSLLDSSLSPVQTAVRVDEAGNIALCSGILLDRVAEAENFAKEYFDESLVKENIEYTIENETFTREMKYARFDDTELLNEIDEKAKEYRAAVVNSTSEYTSLPEDSHNTIYYISNDGNDQNDGKSPQTAWASIDRLNISGLAFGDVVLFRRGDEFRGKIKGMIGVTYSAYGEGAKPIINGSRRNYADPSFWNETDVENVYRCYYALENVGNIVFDYSGEVGRYDETIGELQIVGKNDFSDYHDLSADLQFCSNLDTGDLYLYCEGGNPGRRFKSIEICESGNLFQGSTKDNTVDNLMFIFGGSHGVGSGTVENRTVTNCIFAWIGGSILKGFDGGNTTRYGNAVEVYGGCDGYHVANNWIYQIYDTGITHQYSTNDQVIVMKNIEYDRNIIELCHWSIEYYNRGATPGSKLENVHVHDNITLNGCYGWGSVGREGGGALHNSFQIVDDVTNYVVEDNIFAYSKGNIVRYNEGGDLKITFRHNTYVQYFDRALGYVLGKNEPFNSRAITILAGTFHEEDPIIVFLMNDEEKKAEEAAKEAAKAAAEAEEQAA